MFIVAFACSMYSYHGVTVLYGMLLLVDSTAKEEGVKE